MIQYVKGKFLDKNLSNEWDRLAQGNDYNVAHTDTIDFISSNNVLVNIDVTNAIFVLDYRLMKQEKYRVRIIVGGDKLTYSFYRDSPTTNLVETKIMINSTIPGTVKGVRFCTADIKNMFLATPMERSEYMRVAFKHFPDNIKQRYNLHALRSHDRFIDIKIKKVCMA